MRLHIVRPSAKHLSYQLFARALHPELFDVCATRAIERPGYQVTLRICEAGHLVELRRRGETITEANIDQARELPKRGRCLAMPLGADRDLQAQPLPTVSFQASIQTETLNPDVFERLTQEFLDDSRKADLCHVFQVGNRFRPDAVSLVFANGNPHSLGIQTFHTFPDDLAVVRTQSLYQF